jgi:hypothetical protein
MQPGLILGVLAIAAGLSVASCRGDGDRGVARMLEDTAHVATVADSTTVRATRPQSLPIEPSPWPVAATSPVAMLADSAPATASTTKPGPGPMRPPPEPRRP